MRVRPTRHASAESILIHEATSMCPARVVELMAAAIQPPISIRTGGRVLGHLGGKVQQTGPTRRRRLRRPRIWSF